MLKELLPLALDIRLRNDRWPTRDEADRVKLLCQMLADMQDEAPADRAWPEFGIEQHGHTCFNKPRLAGTRLYLYGPMSGGLFHRILYESGTMAGSELDHPDLARKLADAVEWAAKQWEERKMSDKLGWYRARFDSDLDTGATLVRMDGPYDEAPALPKDAELAFVFEAVSTAAALEHLHDAYRDRVKEAQ